MAGTILSKASTTNGVKAPAAGGIKKKVALGMMALAIMNVTTVFSLRGLPTTAEYGLSSVFYYLIAAVVFLIPVSLISAELASTYPEKGGVFRWVGEAFGADWGFAALYYEWQAIVVWFPTVLIFAAVAIAYIAMPESFDLWLAGNPIYVAAVVLAVFWGVTLYTFRGIASSAKLSTFGGLFGTIVPGAILIVAGIVYVALGHTIHMSFASGIVPKFTGLSSIVLAASIFLFFAGMEMQAVHITELKNPTRDFPMAVWISTAIIVVLSILGTLAISVIIPQQDINLTQSLLVAYNDLWAAFHVPWMGNVMAAMLALGVLGQVSVIVAGPSTGLLAVGKAGYLPKFFQRTNKNGIQVPILIVQGVIVSVLAIALAILPSVQAANQILSQMATIIILAMYVIIYIAAIRLRYTQPNKRRPFKIPGPHNIGLWIVGVIGLIGAGGALVLSFIPPNQIPTGSPITYVVIVSIGSVIFLAIPFVIYAFHKKEWKSEDTMFAPFDWQIEGRKPSEVSKWAAGFVPPPAPADASTMHVTKP